VQTARLTKTCLNSQRPQYAFLRGRDLLLYLISFCVLMLCKLTVADLLSMNLNPLRHSFVTPRPLEKMNLTVNSFCMIIGLMCYRNFKYKATCMSKLIFFCTKVQLISLTKLS
jgi:hypothetical protein